MNEVFELLKSMGIEYGLLEHPPLFTIEDELKYYPQGFPGGVVKNLFLRNKKGNKHYLVVVSTKKKVDLDKLAEMLQENNLSFASPDRLLKYLGLLPGSVSPFGLMHDKNKEVSVIVDAALMENDPISCHPNINTATVILSRDDFKRYLESTGNPVQYLDL